MQRRRQRSGRRRCQWWADNWGLKWDGGRQKAASTKEARAKRGVSHIAIHTFRKAQLCTHHTRARDSPRRPSKHPPAPRPCRHSPRRRRLGRALSLPERRYRAPRSQAAPIPEEEGQEHFPASASTCPCPTEETALTALADLDPRRHPSGRRELEPESPPGRRGRLRHQPRAPPEARHSGSHSRRPRRSGDAPHPGSSAPGQATRAQTSPEETQSRRARAASSLGDDGRRRSSQEKEEGRQARKKEKEASSQDQAESAALHRGDRPRHASKPLRRGQASPRRSLSRFPHATRARGSARGQRDA